MTWLREKLLDEKIWTSNCLYKLKNGCFVEMPSGELMIFDRIKIKKNEWVYSCDIPAWVQPKDLEYMLFNDEIEQQYNQNKWHCSSQIIFMLNEEKTKCA